MKAKQITTTRTQRGFYLAACGNITLQGRARYQVNTHTVSVNFNRCTCYDAKRNNCKHQIAAQLVHQHGRLSVSLAMIMASGGGQLVQTYKGGLGKYWRLEGNDLIGQPMAIEWVVAKDGIERAYPAAIVDAGFGYELVALTKSVLVQKFAPALYEKCKVASVAFLHAALSAHEARSRAAKKRLSQSKLLRQAV